MDPNANLQEQVELARAIVARWDEDQTIPDFHSARLAELVLALNGWITTGGFLPAVWGER